MVDLRKVDPNTIMIPEVRVTARMADEEAEQFKESVKSVGIDDPIKCFEVNGQLVLSDGLHRLQQAIALKLPHIDVFVRPGTMEEVLCNNLFSGHLRGKHPVSEMIKVIKYLDEESKWGIDQICNKTGLTRAYVEKLMIIGRAITPVLEALDSGSIKVGHAEALANIEDAIIQEAVLNQQLLYKWRVPDLVNYIEGQLAAARKLKETPQQQQQPIVYKPKCTFCKQEKELSEVANPCVCTECAGIMFASIAAAKRELEAEIKASNSR